jgi:tight adherence protein B
VSETLVILTIAAAAATSLVVGWILWRLFTMWSRAQRMTRRFATLPRAEATLAVHRVRIPVVDKWSDSGWYRLIARFLAVDDVYDGQRLSRSQMLAIAVIIAVIASVALWLKFLIALPIAIVGGVLFFLLSFGFLLGMERRHSERALIAALPGTIDMLVEMIRSGMAVSSAIRTASADIPPPLGGIFRSIADQNAIGLPLDQVVATMARRIRRPEFGFFAVAVSLQYATGGNLTTSLEDMANMMRRRHATFLKARAIVSEVRMSAVLLTVLPCLSAVVLQVSNPSYMASLFEDRRGHYLLTAAVLCLLAGTGTMYGMMRRNLRI